MRDIILKKLDELEENIFLLEKYLPQDYTDFKHLNMLMRDGIYKRVEYSIEIIFDLLFIIAKNKFRKIPKDDYNVVDLLEEKAFLTSGEAMILRKMRGFRNILVHRYGDIDEMLAFETIKDGLGDLKHFYGKIKRTLASD